MMTATTSLRRAHLINGYAVTWTDTGAIIDGVEIIYAPSRDEASRQISARQRQYMLEGVETHAALIQALKNVPPVYRIAYMGVE
jgi:hypothetical protein